MVIYQLVFEITGPRGHGEPGSRYLCIRTTGGDWYELGDPLPAYFKREDAEAELKKLGKYTYCKIKEIAVI